MEKSQLSQAHQVLHRQRKMETTRLQSQQLSRPPNTLDMYT